MVSTFTRPEIVTAPLRNNKKHFLTGSRLAKKKLSHQFPVTQPIELPEATRPSACGGSVAFRLPITRDLAFS
jgi:hypothetical protein